MNESSPASDNPSESNNPYEASRSEPLDSRSSGSGQRATHVRYGILALVVVMSVLLYLDRLALSPAQTTIGEELGIDEEQQGIMQSCFFYAYALFMIPAGWMADRFGARKMLLIYVATWSIAIAFMGFAESFVILAAGRLFLGLGQAGAYPAAAGLVKKWIPATSRGAANSLISLAGRGGGVLAMAITPILMNEWGRFTGRDVGLWRAVFMMYGFFGIVWCVIYFLKFRDTPAEHPGCNEAERELIRGPMISKQKPEKKSEESPSPQPPKQQSSNYGFYRGVLTMLMMCLINILVNIGWIFLAAWMPSYLQTVHGLERSTAGLMTAITGITGMAGALSGGFLTDALAGRFGLGWGRRIPGMLAGGLGALIYFVCLQSSNVWLLVVLFAMISYVNDLGLAAIWSTYQDIGGKNVATLLSIANMCGNLAAAVFATVIGSYAKEDQWSTVFTMSCISLALVVVCWAFVDAGVPMLKEEDD